MTRGLHDGASPALVSARRGHAERGTAHRQHQRVGGGQAPPDPLQPLSPRERDVLGLIARGYSNKEVARDLRIGEQTVKTHVRAIPGKLGLQDRVQAAIFALRHQAGGRPE
jgi:DNA-binding NarL/FixJ family response regulator